MKVQICGLTDPKDAEYAASQGADYAGLIFSTGSKRHVTLSLAKEIVDAAKRGGAVPVGVFVDATADQMLRICELIDIDHIQLHGPVSHSCLERLLEEQRFSIIYATSVDLDGTFAQQKVLPPEVVPLYDTLAGGTGQAFKWSTFIPPENSRWMLAGGLTPENVSQAIKLFNPYGVDTASGVEFPGTSRKDPHLVQAFIREAKKNYRSER